MIDMVAFYEAVTALAAEAGLGEASRSVRIEVSSWNNGKPWFEAYISTREGTMGNGPTPGMALNDLRGKLAPLGQQAIPMEDAREVRVPGPAPEEVP